MANSKRRILDQVRGVGFLQTAVCLLVVFAPVVVQIHPACEHANEHLRGDTDCLVCAIATNIADDAALHHSVPYITVTAASGLALIGDLSNCHYGEPFPRAHPRAPPTV